MLNELWQQGRRIWGAWGEGGGAKEGCNRGRCLSAAIKLGTPEPKFLQTDQQPVKQHVCLAPDQNMVRPNKVANNLKLTLVPLKKY